MVRRWRWLPCLTHFSRGSIPHALVPDMTERKPIWRCGHDCRDWNCDGCKVVGYEDVAPEPAETTNATATVCRTPDGILWAYTGSEWRQLSARNDECPKCWDTGYQEFIGGGIWTGENVTSRRELCDCPCGDDARDQENGTGLHAYQPHRKYPWFCDECGYAEHERLKHPAQAMSTGTAETACQAQGEACQRGGEAMRPDHAAPQTPPENHP